MQHIHSRHQTQQLSRIVNGANTQEIIVSITIYLYNKHSVKMKYDLSQLVVQLYSVNH